MPLETTKLREAIDQMRHGSSMSKDLFADALEEVYEALEYLIKEIESDE